MDTRKTISTCGRVRYSTSLPSTGELKKPIFHDLISTSEIGVPNPTFSKIPKLSYFFHRTLRAFRKEASVPF